MQDTHSDRSDLDPAGARSSTASFIQLAHPARLSLGGWPLAPLVPPLPGDRNIPFSLVLRLEQQEGMLKESGSPRLRHQSAGPKHRAAMAPVRQRLLPNLDTLCTRQIKGYSHQGRSVTMTHTTAVITIDPLQGHGHTLHAQAFTSTCRRYSENHFTSDHPNLLPHHFLPKL